MNSPIKTSFVKSPSKSPLRRLQTRKILTRRSSLGKLPIDEEIEGLYNTIQQKIKNGYETKNLLPKSEKTFSYIKHILLKQLKTTVDFFIAKLYMMQLKKFMFIINSSNTSKDDLLVRIATQLRCENYEENVVVCRQGERGEKFYVILKGSVTVLIRKEYTVKMSKKTYVKYLSLLYIYNEFDLISKVIIANKANFNVEERDLNNLFIFFRVFRYFKSVNNERAQKYKNFHMFLEGEKKIASLLREKFEYPVEHCFSIMNFTDSDLMEIFNYYANVIESIGLVKVQKFISPCKRNRSPEKILSVVSTESIYLQIIDNSYYDTTYTQTCSVEEYIKRIQPILNPKETDGLMVKLYDYAEVIKLSEGNIFGDVALQSSGKKRTATIITDCECYFGTLTRAAYGQCIKSTQDKIRTMNMLFFLKGPIFNKLNQTIFEAKYFNWFKEVEYSKGDIFYRAKEKRKNIYFIIQGEIEISAYLSFSELNDIIISLGGEIPDEEPLKKLSYDNAQFNLYYFYRKHLFKFCLLKDKEILGLEEFYKNGKYYCDCVCYSPKVKVFELEENFYKYLEKDKIISQNIATYVENKKEILSKRLLTVRRDMINNMLHKIKIDEVKPVKKTFFTSNAKKCKPRIKLGLKLDTMTTSLTRMKTGIASMTATATATHQSSQLETSRNLKTSSDHFRVSTIQARGIKRYDTPLETTRSFAKTKNEKSFGTMTHRTSGPSESNLFRRIVKEVNLNHSYRSRRYKKVLLYGKGGRSMREVKTNYYDNRTVTDDSYVKFRPFFENMIHSRNKYIKNKGVIDCLVLDRWVENNESLYKL